MTLRADLVDSPDPALIDELRGFCAQCPGRTYLQEPDWPLFAPRGARHAYQIATVRDGSGALVLAGVLRRSRLPLGMALGAFRRGPLTRRTADLSPALACLLPLLRRRGMLALTLNPRWEDAAAVAAEAALAGQGGRPVPEARQSLHHVTGLVDVTRPAQEVLETLSRTARRTIRKFDAQGLSVTPMETDGELAQYAAWNAEFIEDRGMAGAGLMLPAQQLAHARAHGGIAAVVRVGGTPAGMFVALRDGDRLLPVGNGWADPKTALPRNYILFWHLIARGAEMPGIASIDLGGLSGAAPADSAAAGRDAFKMHFAPRVVTLPRIHEIVLRSLPHRAAMLARRALA